MQPESTKESLDIDSFIAWLHYNRKPVAIGGAIVVLVLVAFALYNWKKNQNEQNANSALFALPSLVGASGRSAEVRAEEFQKIASEYPNSRVASRAELIAAGVLFTDGKYAEAEKQFAKFLNEHETSPLRSQAAMGVAASLEAQNKVSEAVSKYQELITKYPGENVAQPAKLTLARLLETQNKPEESLKLYEELTRSNNPYDPWAAEARERHEQLLQKFPNLKNLPPAAANVSTSAPAPEAAPTTNAPVK